MKEEKKRRRRLLEVLYRVHTTAWCEPWIPSGDPPSGRRDRIVSSRRS